MNIFVSNLSFNVTDADLKQAFESYGAVSSAKVVMDKYTQRSRGFGFVEMNDQTEAGRAMSELNGSSIDGRAISVNEARPKEDRGQRYPSFGNR